MRLLITVLVLFFFVSCQNERDEIIVSESYLKKIADVEKIGIDHNASIDYMLANNSLNRISDEEMKESIFEYYSNKYPNFNQLSLNNECNCEIIRNLQELIEKNPSISSSKVLRLEQLIAIAGIEDTEDRDAQIRLFMISVIEDNQIEDKESLLGTASIIKYSSRYWRNAFEDSNHQYYANLREQNNGSRICLYCIATIISDALSYQDCMENINTSSQGDAEDRCSAQSSYSSASVGR